MLLKLTKLKYLSLKMNGITEVDPRAFEGLENLEQLYLSFNKIVKLEPKTFEPLTSLMDLFIDHNSKFQPSKELFENLVNLKRLAMYEHLNDFSDLTSDVLDALPRPLTLDFRRMEDSLHCDQLRPIKLKELAGDIELTIEGLTKANYTALTCTDGTIWSELTCSSK